MVVNDPKSVNDKIRINTREKSNGLFYQQKTVSRLTSPNSNKTGTVKKKTMNINQSDIDKSAAKIIKGMERINRFADNYTAYFSEKDKIQLVRLTEELQKNLIRENNKFNSC